MKDEIIKLRRQGLSYNEISKILNCSNGTINHHCSKLKENNEIKSQNLEIKRQKQIKDDSFLLPDEKIIEETKDELFQIKIEKVIVELPVQNSGGPVYPDKNQNGMGNIVSPQP